MEIRSQLGQLWRKENWPSLSASYHSAQFLQKRDLCAFLLFLCTGDTEGSCSTLNDDRKSVKESRLWEPRGRNQNVLILISSFPVDMTNTSSLSKIAWTEEQAQASRAGAAEAPAMEEDDEDDDFEDVEEREEEDFDECMS
ncbi:hypothetical protein LR48_Vigan07g189000 [Vigna angularis]|uniref:Uncharacterized protein n=1 Tax=Phaseolus angularis TaxID=3914 RepID=A0A0L9UZQ7_PHAAN|nr:hypothetical protein LR48_Vigan07g189000 [Vigna angularis]